MRFTLFRILLCVSLALIPIIVPAVDLPKLPMAQQIRTGQLDNGVTYYLVKNSAEKGKADVALVQRAGFGLEDARTAGDSRVFARGSLSDLPHFRTLTPQRFLSRSSIWPSGRGYVSVGPDATVYRFSDLTLPYSPDIVDSTLLMVFDVVGRTDAPAYAPQNQAVIVAGDIDPDALLNKMNMLSMLVTRRSGVRQEIVSPWTGTDTLTVLPLPSAGKTAGLTVRYASARTPRENMSTVQPLVSWRYAREFGILLRKRLLRAYRQASIPVADLDVRYRSSADGPGEEEIEIRLTTGPQRYISAANILARTLASIDRDGTMEAEYRDVQNELEMGLRRAWGPDFLPNGEYVSRCISAYLYDASLASPKSNLDFFLTRSMDPKAATDLFNTYVGALLDAKRNLTVGADLDLLPEARIHDLFSSAWSQKPEEETAYVVSHSDTLTLSVPKGRVRLKTDEAEPLSGGRMWTFANGIRVIYKQVPTPGVFHYTWLLKGGYGTTTGIKPGEGPYLGDMLALDNVADMKYSAFQDMLQANGITLEPNVTLTDIRLGGSAPTSRLPLLLKSLLSLSERRSPDADAFRYYRECEILCREGGKGGLTARQAVLDSLVHPDGLAVTPYRRAVALPDDFQQRAETFYSGAFSRMSDGVLILAGSFDENALKRVLSQYLGGFRTERATAGRFRSPVRQPAGRMTLVTNGAARSLLDLELTAQLDYTVEHSIAANIAARVLSDVAADVLSSRGWYSEARWRFDLFPSDCFTLDILSSLADPEGLPASLMPVDSAGTVLQEVRTALAKAAADGISAARLKACKTELVNRYNTGSADPETIISMLVLRYSYGKDLLTKYGDKVAAVTRDQVGRVMKLLVGGPSAEHLVRAASSGETLHVSEPEEPQWPSVEVPRPPVDSTGMLDLYRELFGEQTFPLTPIL